MEYHRGDLRLWTGVGRWVTAARTNTTWCQKVNESSNSCRKRDVVKRIALNHCNHVLITTLRLDQYGRFLIDILTGEALVSERTLRRRRLELQLLLELRAGTDDGSMRWPLHLWRECSTTTGEPHSHDVLRTIFAMHGLAGFPFGAADRHRDLSTTAAKYVVTVKRNLF
ncbi:hypothetical protein HPB51_027532 [Rhipicephalus microplus]|uniref:Uncharacterized protein n=1 Tax=Rhipicephalus microplus TaxID=6941 RepID=A0A9J6D008_RHIMP|nr:hypothetical protein HPB51_027532 [Rhipicephalus microplus]